MNNTEQIINKLFNHGISKSEAIELLEFTKNIPAGNSASALNEAVKAIYFNDSSDYLTALYGVVHHLFDIDRDKITDKFIKNLFDMLNPEDDD